MDAMTESVLARHRERHSRAYATGVLVPEVHHRLVEDLDRYAAEAGVVPSDVWTPLGKVCGDDAERDFVVRYRHRSSPRGLIYLGLLSPPVSLRCRAIAGAFLRNFISARVISAETVVTDAMAGALPDASVLLVPDFCPPGVAVPPVRQRALASMMLERHSSGRKTVIGVESAAEVRAKYGPELAQLLEAGYSRVAA